MQKYKKEIAIIALIILSIIVLSKSVFKQNIETERKNLEQLALKEMSEWQGIDTWAFGDAFNYMHSLYGEGHIFEWRDSKYKVILKEGKQDGK